MLDKEISRIWLPLDPRAKNMLCKDPDGPRLLIARSPFPRIRSIYDAASFDSNYHVASHVETADRSCGNAYALSVLVRNAVQVVVAGIKVAEGFCRMITVFETC